MSDLQDKLDRGEITPNDAEEERRREAELDALRLQITKDDPGYFHRLADRIIAEFEAEGGGITMEELLGMPASDDLPE